MAQKKKAKLKKNSWLTTVLIYIFVPLTIWFLAFVTWLYWDSITALFSKDKVTERPTPRSTRTKEKNQAAPAKRPQEKILEDDRKKLEDILKQRQ